MLGRGGSMAYASRRSAIGVLREYPRWSWFLPWRIRTYLFLVRHIRDCSGFLEAIGCEWRTQRLDNGKIARFDDKGYYIWGSEDWEAGEESGNTGAISRASEAN